MNNATTAISIRNLEVRYGSTVALEGISLEIPENRVTVFIGPSGCGKSTTLRSINGLVKAHGGSIRYRGTDILEQDPNELRRQMGYAIQSVGLIPHMTVGQNVTLVPRLLGWDPQRRNERCGQLLSLVKLDPEIYADKYPHELSGGEGQRVGVARALGADPPVLLMDEPFGAVDPLNREILQDEFIRIQRKLKKTVVFVTHDLEEAVRLADHLVIMKAGRVVQADSPEAILANPADEFVEQFLGPDRAIKRLTLFTADRSLSSADYGEAEAPAEEGRVHWTVDTEGRPVLGVALIDGTQVRRPVDMSGQCVVAYSSLKECMSRILSLGLPAVPVVDENGALIGEVRYESIRKISIQ